MSTFLLVLAAWTAAAFLLGLVVGASVRTADEAEAPDFTADVRVPRSWVA